MNVAGGYHPTRSSSSSYSNDKYFQSSSQHIPPPPHLGASRSSGGAGPSFISSMSSNQPDIFDRRNNYDDRTSNYHGAPSSLDRGLGGGSLLNHGPRPLMEQRLLPPMQNDHRPTMNMMIPQSSLYEDRRRNMDYESSTLRGNDLQSRMSSDSLAPRSTRELTHSESRMREINRPPIMDEKRILNPSSNYRDEFADRRLERHDNYNNYNYPDRRRDDYGLDSKRPAYQPPRERSPPIIRQRQEDDIRPMIPRNEDFMDRRGLDAPRMIMEDKRNSRRSEEEQRYHRHDERPLSSTMAPPRFRPEEDKQVEPRRSRNEDRRSDYERSNRDSSPRDKTRHSSVDKQKHREDDRSKSHHRDNDRAAKPGRRNTDEERSGRRREEEDKQQRRRPSEESRRKLTSDDHRRSPTESRKRRSSEETSSNIDARSTRDLLKDRGNNNSRRTSSPVEEKRRRVSPKRKSSPERGKHKAPVPRPKSPLTKKFSPTSSKRRSTSPTARQRRDDSSVAESSSRNKRRSGDDERRRHSASPRRKSSRKSRDVEDDEGDRRNRTSALKRLGPKLSITDRLGSKDKKEGVNESRYILKHIFNFLI